MANKPPTANRKPKSKSSPLLVFLVLAAIGAGAYWFVSRRRAVEAASSEPKAAASVTSVIHLDSFVVNLADRNRSAFLKIGIDLGVSSTAPEGKSGDANAAVLPKIRDTILSVLTTWQSSGLLAADGKLRLKEQILDALHQQVPAVPVKEVYFTEFLVQQ